MPRSVDRSVHHSITTPIRSQGALPKDLVGTLYRNGAGRIRVGERLRYGHWFDGAPHTRPSNPFRIRRPYLMGPIHHSYTLNQIGDGFVSAATLTGDGRCLFRQRYLRGPKLLAQVRTCMHV